MKEWSSIRLEIYMKDEKYPDIRGKVPPVAKLYYINGLVYHVAKKGKTTMEKAFRNRDETVKSGDAENIIWIERLSRFAEALDLIIIDDRVLTITERGKIYFESRDEEDPWRITEDQAKILREYVREDITRNDVVYSINTLLRLLDEVENLNVLKDEFSEAINRDDSWKSDTTRKDYLRYGLNYLEEMRLIEPKTLEPKVESNYLSPLSAEETELFDGLFFVEKEAERLRKTIEGSLNLQKNLVLYGPPGTGKTSLAKLICRFYDDEWLIIPSALGSNIDGIFKTIKDEKPGWIIFDNISDTTVENTFFQMITSIGCRDDEVYNKKLNDCKSILINDGLKEDTIKKDDYTKLKDTSFILTVDTYEKEPFNLFRTYPIYEFSFIPVKSPKSDEIDVELMKDYIRVWDEKEDKDTIDKISKIWKIINEVNMVGPGIIKNLYKYLLEEKGDIEGGLISFVFPHLREINEERWEKIFYKIESELDVDMKESIELILGKSG